MLAVLLAIVFAVNLLPAFGPPTWTIIAIYGLASDLPLIVIVLAGALAAAAGRLVLAGAFRMLGDHVPPKTRGNLEAARLLFERNRRNGIIGIGVFALSPFPSAQLFEAIGLAKLPLVRFTLAFFAGRLVSYAFYAMTAKQLRDTSLGQEFARMFSDPWVLAIELVMIAALVSLLKIDWRRILERR
ncbi:hypothetical protein HQR01_15090 [Erythrobacter mangrovi]|uniref:VTT domain-containing protein n=2 Tax=Erythrobacter mangrovi TaxID=2739433 RepID=A0A7D3XXZ3_9SPHN|nr:hypothetical protein HQR01_15090 [Erythrobacter mangrovi]